MRHWPPCARSSPAAAEPASASLPASRFRIPSAAGGGLGMVIVGLTGGIGSGKSTVATRLAELGAVVIDADVVARQIVEPGTEGLAVLVEAFGPTVLLPDGTLDRAGLARLVFDDAKRRQTLNGLLHPRIAARTAELVSAAPQDAVVVHDVPLLVENGLAPNYALVIVVNAREAERVRRLVEGRGMPPEQAWSRVHAQAGDDERRAVADVWIDNCGTRAETLAQVDACWRDRILPLLDSPPD